MQEIGLLLLGKKGLETTLALKKNGLLSKVAFVVIGTDKAIKKDYFEEIRDFCVVHNVAWFTRQEFSKKSLLCDLLVAIGWRWLVNLQIYKLVTIHDSILPKYRGFNPLVTALIEGDNKIGATAIMASAGIDEGDIIAQREVDIEYPIKISAAIDIMSHLYVELVLEIFSNDELQATPQNDAVATYSLWRNEEDYAIDWNWDSKRIVRFINAVGKPYLNASTKYKGQKIRIIEASIIPDKNIVNRVPGKLFKVNDNQPEVVCGVGMLQINKAIYEQSDSNVIFDRLREKLK